MKKFLIPIAFFALLGLLLAYGLKLDPRRIPSPLVGKPLPAFSLPTLEEPRRSLSDTDLRGQVVLINVWASWCVACKEEHPVLVEMARQKVVPIIGLNYKDKRADALGALAHDGNPYSTSVMDADGRVGLDWGVYGVPETFVIDKQGIIREKHIGPIRPDDWQDKLLPLINRLNAEPATAGR